MSDKPTPTDLSECLKVGLDEAVQDYVAFKQNDKPTDSKGFTAYHNACKAVLTHIALLMKLIQCVASTKGEKSSKTDWIRLADQTLGKEEDSDDVFFD